MHNKEAYGVWGGMRPADRLRMRMKYPASPERWTWQPEQLAEDATETMEEVWHEAA
jgi:hypothetical protein